ncbi:MAG: CvpA family protein [bacterium]|nr:CvpA family protein [bacterium]
MNWLYLDAGLLTLVGVFAIVGLLKGIGAEVVSLLAACGALATTFAARTLLLNGVLGWLQRQFPQAHFDGVMAKFAAMIVTVFVVYLLLSAVLDAVRVRMAGRQPPSFIARVYGMLLGGVVVALVWLADMTKPQAGRVLNADDVARYEELLDQAQLVVASRSAVGLLCERCPLVSNTLWSAEAAMQAGPGDSTNPPPATAP